MQNSPDCAEMRPDLQKIPYADRICLFTQEYGHNNRRGSTRDQRRDTGAGHSQLKHIDQKGVQADIDDIHDHRGIHGHLGIALGPKQRRAAVVNRQKRIGQSRQEKINACVFHDALLYTLVDPA